MRTSAQREPTFVIQMPLVQISLWTDWHGNIELDDTNWLHVHVKTDYLEMVSVTMGAMKCPTVCYSKFWVICKHVIPVPIFLNNIMRLLYSRVLRH